MGNKLEGKIAIITGGNSGIGLATAKRFVSDGAYVFITGRRQNELDATVSEIGKNVTGIQGDVSNLADLDRLYNTVKDQKGHLDILFANAGIGEFALLGEISETHFDKIFGINLKGVLFSAESTPAVSGWRFDHLECFYRSIQRNGGIKCLQCNQGSSTFVRSHLDFRSETSQDSCQRCKSWAY